MILNLRQKVQTHFLMILNLISETPILGNKMGMRRETLKALEQVRDNVVTERKQSRMQTLGASNPHNNNRDKHRAATKVTHDTVDRIFANGGGLDNQGFEGMLPSTDDDINSSRNSSARVINPLRGSVTWKGRERDRPDRIHSDQHSSSATSKM